MGLLEDVARFFQGKPVFQDPGTVDRGPAANDPRPLKTPTDERGYKLIPEVQIQPCHTHFNGDSTLVTAWVTNTSKYEVELDKIILAGMTRRLGRRLQPGEAHELTLYEGPVPTNDHDYRAHLYYRQVSSDDYFLAEFRVEYQRQSDGTFGVVQLFPEHPIKDI